MISKKLIILSLLFILFTSNVFAIGISPPKYTILFKPNHGESIEFTIVNDNSVPIEAELYVKMDQFSELTTNLTQYVTLDREILKIPSGYMSTFRANVMLPEFIEEPGKHRILVGAVEGNPNVHGIGARAAIQAPIVIDVPYPGKYIRWVPSAARAKENEPVNIKLNLHNRGKETISSAYAIIDILDYEYKKIDSLITQTININLDEEKTLEKWWNTKERPSGTYHANITLFYDGNIDTKLVDFHIGKLFVEIINFTSQAKIDNIQPIEIYVKSNWNDNIPGVYATFRVHDEFQKTYVNLKTPAEDLNPWQPTKLQTYWDTNNVFPKEYLTNITIIYSGNENSQAGKIDVLNITEEPELNIDATSITVILVVLLVVMNFFWFYYMYKKNNKTVVKTKKDKK